VTASYVCDFNCVSAARSGHVGNLSNRHFWFSFPRLAASYTCSTSPASWSNEAVRCWAAAQRRLFVRAS